MKTLVTFILVACCGLAHAQQFSLGAEVYMGTFSMSLLKQYQALSEDYYIPFATVQNFPARPGVRLIGSLNSFGRVTTGLGVGLISTGSRMAYSDFTGQAYRDVIVSGLQFGSHNRIMFFNHKPWTLHARLNFGGVLNKVEFENRIHLEDPAYEATERSDWSSVNFFAETGIEAGYKWRRFYFKLFTSYEFNVPGEMRLRSGEAPQEEPFSVEWNGLRTGLGIDFKLSESN